MIAAETAQEYWLECQLDRGMFSDEIAISYPPVGQTIHSVFVPISVVRGTPGYRGKVRVNVFKRHGKTFAVLPTPERAIVAVADQDISESP
jgi:hypothetical protein